MTQDDSFTLFLRVLKMKHQEIKNSISNLYSVLLGNDANAKKQANTKLHKSCNDLITLLHSKDRPGWLVALQQKTQWYMQHHSSKNANETLMNALIENRESAMKHSWTFISTSTLVDFNFDKIYEHFRNESNLPNLFNELISTIEKIIESNEIDSIHAVSSLRSLLDLLKYNKSGSYLGTSATLEFAKRFTKNLFWLQLEKVPVIKDLKSTFEKTLDDMHLEMDQIRSKFSEKVRIQFDKLIPHFDYEDGQDLLVNDCVTDLNAEVIQSKD